MNDYEATIKQQVSHNYVGSHGGRPVYFVQVTGPNGYDSGLYYREYLWSARRLAKKLIKNQKRIDKR